MLHLKTFSGFHDGMYGLDTEEVQEHLKEIPFVVKIIAKTEGMLIIGHEDTEQASAHTRVAELEIPVGMTWGGSSNTPKAREAEVLLNGWTEAHPKASIQTIISDKSRLFVFYIE